jgi:hypothetical protein
MASPTPAPATRTKRNQSDPYSDWALDTIAHLTNKLNNEIHIKKSGPAMTLSNIHDNDLKKLQFLTPTHQSKRHLRIGRIDVSINDSNGTPLTLQLPGLSQMVSQMFIDSASESFFANEKTHRPFKPSTAKAVVAQSMVGDMVDMLTATMHSMPKTAGNDKKYNLTVHTSINPIHFNPNAYPPTTCPAGSRQTEGGGAFCTPTN